MRKEAEIPQPTELKEISASNFDDADLDLTLVEEVTLLKETQPAQKALTEQAPKLLIETNEKPSENNNFTQVTQQTSTTKTAGKFRQFIKIQNFTSSLES